MRKIGLKALYIMSVVLCLSSCIVTKELYKKTGYVDYFSSVLITEDGKKLLVVTEKYHYLFDADPNLISMLASPIKTKIRAGFNRYLIVDKDQSTSIEFYLSVVSDASPEEVEKAIDLGFEERPVGQYKRIYRLTGERYKKRENMHDLASVSLNQKYRVNVREEKTVTKRAKEILLTPVALTADGIYTLAVSPFVILLLIAHSSN